MCLQHACRAPVPFRACSLCPPPAVSAPTPGMTAMGWTADSSLQKLTNEDTTLWCKSLPCHMHGESIQRRTYATDRVRPPYEDSVLEMWAGAHLRLLNAFAEWSVYHGIISAGVAAEVRIREQRCRDPLQRTP